MNCKKCRKPLSPPVTSEYCTDCGFLRTYQRRQLADMRAEITRLCKDLDLLDEPDMATSRIPYTKTHLKDYRFEAVHCPACTYIYRRNITVPHPWTVTMEGYEGARTIICKRVWRDSEPGWLQLWWDPNHIPKRRTAVFDFMPERYKEVETLLQILKTSRVGHPLNKPNNTEEEVMQILDNYRRLRERGMSKVAAANFVQRDVKTIRNWLDARRIED